MQYLLKKSTEPKKTSALQKLQGLATDLTTIPTAQAAERSKGLNLGQPGEPFTPKPQTEAQKATQPVFVRDVFVSPKDFNDEFRPVAFGEISNRSPKQQELEARVILNTAINRMKEYAKHGQYFTLAEVLKMPNQYQAQGGKQYQIYKGVNHPATQELDAKKKTALDHTFDELLAEAKAGTLKDNTNGAFYYIHNPDGSITYDDKRPLFK